MGNQSHKTELTLIENFSIESALLAFSISFCIAVLSGSFWIALWVLHYEF